MTERTQRWSSNGAEATGTGESNVRLGFSILLSAALHVLVLAASDGLVFRLGSAEVAASSLGPLTVTLRASHGAAVPAIEAPPPAPAPVMAHLAPVASANHPPAAETEPAVKGSPESAVRPPANLGPIPGPWYFKPKWLHRRPMPSRPVSPAYPPEFQEIAGRVQLLLFINEFGGVDDRRIVESEPAGVFDQAVIEAFTRVTYSPGFITGYAVRSQFLVEVTFDPGKEPGVTLIVPPTTPAQ